MATELTFAKTFLSLLDSKPSKISPDHIEDPRSYPGTSPYILPRHPSYKPFSKSTYSSQTTPDTTTGGSSSSSAKKKTPGSERAVKVVLRSPRNPPFEVVLPACALSTSLAEVKERVADQTGIEVDKIKLLHNKKPAGADSKSLKDLLPAPTEASIGEVELGVMILGGAAAVVLKKKEEKQTAGEGQEGGSAAPVAQGLSGIGVLQTEEFWGDLKGFLQQRVRDEAVAGEAVGVFKTAWDGRSSKDVDMD
ncbi:hypothetical protein N657DRAFT_624402 [Parathielavia appendiculata]|uniref:Ubiquitin-like domain-containing protein n=1 Tax=Parathielavia appendiculata TaxID=2587402 RepID=A0AAN6TVP6_9PEZI|nr:hypothetical protein N657DRAFT_624402 [Parathielavia appendiculata]